MDECVFKPILRHLLALTMLLAPAIGSAHPLSFADLYFDPLAESRNDRPGSVNAHGEGLSLVQFLDMPAQGARDSLVQAGFRPLQYYPHHAWLVWGEADGGRRLAQIPGMRWQGSFSPDWKLAPSLRDPSSSFEQLALLAYDDANLGLLEEQLRPFGIEWLAQAAAQPDGRLQTLWLRAGRTHLELLTALPQVLWIEAVADRPQLEDEIASQIVAGNTTLSGDPTAPDYLAWLDNLGLTGHNVTFAVTDSGIDYSNPEFQGRIVAGHDFPGCESAPGRPGDDKATGGHGSHVAGILAGAGVVANATDPAGYHYGIGIAPQLRLVSLNPLCGTLTGAWPGPGGWQQLSRIAIERGAVGANYSWTTGEGSGVGYIGSARTHDFIVRDGNFDTPAIKEPFVIVSSAGNSGPAGNTITSPKEAKNLIVVGSSLNQRAGSIEVIANNSSRGPARDGRVVPTIAAPGAVVASTRRVAGAVQCAQAIGSLALGNYAFCSGTSMAAGQVSGVIALLIQDWRQRHGGATPSPAMLKALLVNGAVDMAGPGPIPNAHEGWGRVQLVNSLGREVETTTIDQQVVLSLPGEAHERSYLIDDPDKPVRVTLTWTDAPAATGANPALVNDLDLEVEHQGTVFRGNVFSAGISVAGGQADRINNVENVFLGPRSGTLKVRVRAHALPGDGVPLHGDETDQDFALVCSNCRLQSQFDLSLDSTQASLCAGDTLQRTLSLAPVGGFNATVTLSASGWPAPGSLQFLPSALSLPGSAQLQLGSLGVATGDYQLAIGASGGGVQRQASLGVYVAGTPPGPVDSLLPAPGSIGVPVQPLLSWSAAPAAFDYRIELARDAGFEDLVLVAETRSLSLLPDLQLDSDREYHWRVRPRNACPVAQQGLFEDGFESGQAEAGGWTLGSFRTMALPSDCPLGRELLLAEDMEQGPGLPPGWTGSAAIGSNNWAVDAAFAHQGVQSLRGIAPDSASDQRVETPELQLPDAGGGLWLRFWHRLDLEPGFSGCADAGQVQLALDGAPFAGIDPARLSPPYSGNLLPSNPASPGQGWCGTLGWRPVTLELSEHAGRSLRVGWRLTANTHSQRPEGWAVDSVEIYRCLPPAAVP